jgi:hypothetical protein
MTKGRGAVEISIGPTTGAVFPGLGLAFPDPVVRPSDGVLDLLLGLRLAHLRVRLELGSATWRAALGHAAATGLATATSLELVVRVGRRQVDLLETLAHELRLAQVGIARFIIEQKGGTSGHRLAAEASSILTPVAPEAGFGVAPRLATAGGEIPVQSIASLPLRGWRAALEREREQIVRAIGDGRPFAASPVVASALAHRGPSPVGAAFAVSSLAMLALAGASSVSYAAPTGWGVIRRRRDGREVVTPAYHVLADVGECEFGQVGRPECSNDEAAAVVCIYTLDGVRLLVANVTQAPLRVVVGSLAGPARLLTISAASFPAVVEEPERFRRRGATTIRRPRRGVLALDLDPWSVARLDV